MRFWLEEQFIQLCDGEVLQVRSLFCQGINSVIKFDRVQDLDAFGIIQNRQMLRLGVANRWYHQLVR